MVNVSFAPYVIGGGGIMTAYARIKLIKSEARSFVLSNLFKTLMHGFMLLFLFSGCNTLCEVFFKLTGRLQDGAIIFCVNATFVTAILFVFSLLFAVVNSIFFRSEKYEFALVRVVKIVPIFWLCFFVLTGIASLVPFVSREAILLLKAELRLFNAVCEFFIYTVPLMVFLIAVIFLCGVFMVLFFRDDEYKSLTQKVRKSTLLMKGHKAELLLLNLSFIPLFFLVYFTFGAAFVFVAPYYITALYSFASYVSEDGKKPIFTHLHDIQ